MREVGRGERDRGREGGRGNDCKQSQDRREGVLKAKWGTEIG